MRGDGQPLRTDKFTLQTILHMGYAAYERKPSVAGLCAASGVGDPGVSHRRVGWTRPGLSRGAC